MQGLKKPSGSMSRASSKCYATDHQASAITRSRKCDETWSHSQTTSRLIVRMFDRTWRTRQGTPYSII